ncbi:hypothetical protein C8046_12065 [Serinibacter arcticus]|uniref:DUF1648 domain-containing protein n=1 Tax=Serinibacter arcticus TaxID=1655435 RepID=A0A2U1ZWD6_9MICO|nr:DUF1648 domain-containing protein [Serinibacter arcticus]PWD51284.1 hypothetical protein C8046_12065 [Serinibacter arcticus]
MPSAAATRPRRTYRTGLATQILRGLALLGMLAVTIAVLRAYPDLPDTVPTHFGANGQPDSYGPRWSLLVLVGIWWVLLAGIGWLSARPRMLNYPLVVTESNAQLLYREAERMLVWLMIALVVVGVAMIVGVLGHQVGWLIWVGLAGTLAVTVAGIVRMIRVDGRTDPDA